MKFRNTVIMALVLVVLGGFVYFYEIRGREAREAAKEREAKIVAFETEQVTRLTLSSADGRIVVARTDEGWRLEEPVQAPADTVGVENAINSLQGAEHERVVTEEADDLASYGLAEPELTAVLELEDGTEHTVELGSGTPVGYNVYARRAAEPTVYITGASLKDDLSVEPFDLRDKSVLTFEEGDIQRLDIAGPDLDLRLVRNDEGPAAWRISRPLEARADGPTITDLLNGLRNAEAEAFVAESAGPEALAGWGLDEPRLTLTLWTGDDASQTLEVGGESEDPAGFYARRRGSDTVFVISEDNLADVPGSANAIRNRSVVTVDRPRVRWIDITRGSDRVRVERETPGWRITEPREIEADASAVSALISDLSGLRAEDFATGAEASGFEPPYARIRVALDPEEADASAPGSPEGDDSPDAPGDASDAPGSGQESTAGQEESLAGQEEDAAGQEIPATPESMPVDSPPEEIVLTFGATVEVETPDETGDGTGTGDGPAGDDPDAVATTGGEAPQDEAGDGTETLRYVTVSGDPTVYLVPESDVEGLVPDLYELRSKTLVSFTQSELTRLTVESGGTTWTVEKEGDAWSLVEPETRQIEDTPVTNMLWDLTYLRMEGIGAEWEGTPPDLSEYGLESPALHIRGWVGEEQVADLAVGDGVPPETVGDESAGEQVWVRPADASGVFRVTARVRDSAEALIETLSGGA